MKVLLAEPYYDRKYPPLGLMKLSTWHKKKGDEVRYHRGQSWIGIDNSFNPDLILISSLFTWDLDEVIVTVNSFKHRFPQAKIMVGGVGASAMPRYIEKRTGIKPHVGFLPEVDECVPDYSMSDETTQLDESMVFTTRGCAHKCQYCIVKTIEPVYSKVKHWEKAIDPQKSRIVVFDNNLLAADEKHVESVFNALERTGKWFDINSGFDVFLFKRKHAERIASLKIKPIRFAFDKMAQEKALIESVQLCNEAGIKTDTIRVYVLYNYEDTIKEARYRAEKVIELGCKPFVMRYKPLNWLQKEDYISPTWTDEDIRDFTQYYNMPVVWNQMTYDEFKDERNDFSRLRKELRVEKRLDRSLF
jgi:hypothetical protein